jgi:hypothetical protein
VTSQQAQIQTLINEIDQALSKTSPRLPWVLSTDALQQRQVLEQTRAYLTSLQSQMDADGMVAIAGAGAPAYGALPSQNSGAEESAQQVLQAVLQEMNYLRVNMLQPLRSDVEILRQQREALTQEVRQLEAYRQQYGLPHQAGNQQVLMEFLQSAMAQMQENLSGQMAQMMASITAQPSAQALPGNQSDTANAASLSPAQRLQQLQQVQAQSDQLVMKLDANLRVLFDSLQNNVQSYQDSLEQGLNRMHNLGQQGEAMFAALVTRLAQQLAREASSFLKTSMQTSDWAETNRPSLASQDTSPTKPTSDPEIVRLLNELNALQPEVLQFAPDQPDPVDSMGQDPKPPTLEFGPGSLDALDRELDQLDLSAIPPESEATPDDDTLSLFQGNQDLASLLDDGSITLRQIDAKSSWAAPDPVAPPSSGAEIADLDSALELLTQLSAEAQLQPSTDPDAIASTDTEEQEPSTPPDTDLVTNPDNLYEDGFYQNLFSQQTASDELAAIELPEPDAPQMGHPDKSTTTADLHEEWFAGLTDPAARDSSVNDSEALSLPDFPTVDQPRSVESFLMDRADQPSSADSDLSNFLDDETDAATDLLGEWQNAIAAPTDTDTNADETWRAIVSSTDNPSQADSSQPDLEAMIDLEGDISYEADYEPAQPDENLIIDQASPDEPVDLRLAADTLQQLTTDLSRLEPSEASSSEFAVTDDADWTLVDWAGAVESPEESPPSASDLPLNQLEVVADEIASELSSALADDEANEATVDDLFFSDDFTTSTPEEATVDDLFSAVPSNPEVTSETTKSALDAENPSSRDAFTLEGLEELFEDIPDPLVEPPQPIVRSDTDTQSFTLENAFGSSQASADTTASPAEADSSESGDAEKKNFPT